MTDTTLEAQQESFNQPLAGADVQAVNALVNQHKGNAALTQQLALDASRLMTTSQERLAKQSGSGFFKRFASKISGKNSENQLLNQVDMLQMQRCAWHYLKQLQQQNLISAQSIAVIRNNLGTMNDYIIETRDFLELAVDKINPRLEHVENNTSFNNWSVQIDANKVDFESIPANLLVLYLTYDFMRTHRDVVLTSRDINYLVVTLQKLAIDCKQEVQLLGFIIELIDQIGIQGIEPYREMIKLACDGLSVDSHFIQSNISGIGFNALYFLAENYEKIVELIEDRELCKNDQDREKFIRIFFGKEFSGLSTTYRMRDLIEEVIAGSQLAIDIFKDVNGLNVVPDQVDEVEHPETVSLTSSLPDIEAHSFLDNTDSEEARRNYLRLFALCVDNSTALNTPSREFLALLSEKAGCAGFYGNVARLADSSYKTQELLPVMQALLSDDDKVYTWLLDAFFLTTLCQKKIENPQMVRILSSLKPTKVKDNLPHMMALIHNSDEVTLVDAAAKLAKHTFGWKNIIRYRELRFDKTYAEAEKNLHSARIAVDDLRSELSEASTKASSNSNYWSVFDDSLPGKVSSAVERVAYSLGRSSSLSSLNNVRKKYRVVIAERAAAWNLAAGMIARLNMPRIEFNDDINYVDYELDNSADNNKWGDQFRRFECQVENTLTAFSRACSDTEEQLGYFKAGEFDKSVVEIKVQKRAAAHLRQQLDKQAKQSIVIEKDGREHRFSIEWQDFETPPCDPEKIRDIKTKGNVWLIIDDDGVFYRSEDCRLWQPVQPKVANARPDVRNLQVVNDVWILRVDSDEGFYFSSDALTWQQSSFPELPSTYGFSKTEDIVYFNGQWLWRFTERTKYSYTEKGLLFDSKKTSTYEKSLIYCADRLDARWERWEATPSLPECVGVNSIHSLPGVACLIVFCEHDTNRGFFKTEPTQAFVNYYIPGKDWRACTWGGDDKYRDYFSRPFFTRMADRLMCFNSNQFLTSDKGYDWKRQPAELRVGDCFHLEEVSLFPSRSDHQVIYLSQDGKTFKEYMLGEGTWKYFSANDQGVLGVYAPNSHETFLRVGKITWQPIDSAP